VLFRLACSIGGHADALCTSRQMTNDATANPAPPIRSRLSIWSSLIYQQLVLASDDAELVPVSDHAARAWYQRNGALSVPLKSQITGAQKRARASAAPPWT
jgi:hypothetical protein